jgi:hypothetical protein
VRSITAAAAIYLHFSFATNDKKTIRNRGGGIDVFLINQSVSLSLGGVQEADARGLNKS